MTGPRAVVPRTVMYLLKKKCSSSGPVPQFVCTYLYAACPGHALVLLVLLLALYRERMGRVAGGKRAGKR